MTAVSEVRGREAGSHDRAFYGTMAVAMALTVFAGFAPTYYSRFFSGGPSATLSGGPFTTLVHVHGALFTAWVVLFVVQTALVASRRVAVHRRLGIAGAAIAGAMIVVGATLAVATAKRGGAPPGADPLAFLIVPIFDMVLFATFVTAALVRRRDKEAHKRLMILAYVSILVAGIVYDYVTRRRVHPVYLWGGALLVISVPLRLGLSTTSAWRGFAEMLTR
jgi:hypothetical protein